VATTSPAPGRLVIATTTEGDVFTIAPKSEPDAIAAPRKGKAKKDFFDLSGRRATQPTAAGVYVSGGKKVAVR
jgi:hypothetical protein